MMGGMEMVAENWDKPEDVPEDLKPVTENL